MEPTCVLQNEGREYVNHAVSTDAIEFFAQLCALIDHGFSTRAEVLAAASLDDNGWRALCEECLPRLASGDDPTLAQRFAPAYARARQYPGYHALPDAIPRQASAAGVELHIEDTDTVEALPVFLADDAAIDAAPVVRPDLDRTVEAACPLVGPVLPSRFAAPPPPGPRGDTGSPEQSDGGACRASVLAARRRRAPRSASALRCANRRAARGPALGGRAEAFGAPALNAHRSLTC
jgi:hypothetical protein